MTTYTFRNRKNKVIRGSITASSVNELFYKIDDKADPFSFEYCKTNQDTVWFDEEPVWLVFKSFLTLKTETDHTLILATEATKEIVDNLQKKLSEPHFDNYTCFLMARSHLSIGDLDGALECIRSDIDKLSFIDKKLYDYVNYLIQN